MINLDSTQYIVIVEKVVREPAGIFLGREEDDGNVRPSRMVLQGFDLFDFRQLW
jgi:hypothetical protein